jgi:glucose-1-phosphate adenylyltransferase
MNFEQMMATHRDSGADVTISAVPVASSDASGLGIMRLDDTGRVVGFLEKPQSEEDIQLVRTDPAWIDAQGIPSRGRDCLASMGIYLFNRDTLVEVLEKTDYHDFGKEIFPTSIRVRHVQVHLFDGYWEDIGTIRSFFEANLQLATESPPFDLASVDAPIYSRARFLPPTRIEGATIRGSLLADGCTIDAGAVIENSVIGLRCRIGRDVVIRNAILMGNDYYRPPGQTTDTCGDGRPPLGVGDGTRIEGAIIDKNCHIGRNVQIVNRHGVESTEETPRGMVCDGVVVIPKDAVLPDDWSL